MADGEVLKILARWRSGTMRSMVEGHGRLLTTFAVMRSRPCPSTPTLRVAVPLPVPGRIL
jgi:hypothetical protein